MLAILDEQEEEIHIEARHNWLRNVVYDHMEFANKLTTTGGKWDRTRGDERSLANTAVREAWEEMYVDIKPWELTRVGCFRQTIPARVYPMPMSSEKMATYFGLATP